MAGLEFRLLAAGVSPLRTSCRYAAGSAPLFHSIKSALADGGMCEASSAAVHSGIGSWEASKCTPQCWTESKHRTYRKESQSERSAALPISALVGTHCCRI